MKRLSGMDAAFLYAETPSVHMHTLKVAIVEPPLNVAPHDLLAGFRDALQRRLHLLPPFRLRAVEIPFGLHHPVWVEDPDFDLCRHLHRVTLPIPGDESQLNAVVSKIASTPLHRDRPLWEVWMIDGLKSGDVAYVAKLHHALADGTAASGLLENIMSSEPGVPVENTSSPSNATPLPSRGKLVRDALKDQPRRFAKLPALLAQTIEGGLSLLQKRREHPNADPILFHAPHTPFNGALSPGRTFATVKLSFETLREVKTTLNVTVNDVVLAVVAGALRNYLGQRGVDTSQPLIATIPVAFQQGSHEKRLVGNRLSNLFTSLSTHIENPIERIRAIHNNTQAAKATQDSMGIETLHAWTEYLPPKPYSLGLKLYSGLNLANWHRSPANVIVSNVRGPAQPLFISHQRLKALYSVGPVLEGMGLNLTAWSYAGDLYMAMLANAEIIEDPSDLMALMPKALEGLAAATELLSQGPRAAA